MPTYKIGLSRTYLITIEAEDRDSAKRLSEFFVGETNLSTPREQKNNRFTISDIEIVDNEVFECENVDS